jgi:4-hydroxythreonine-4-phosphate dehydrogenase
MSSRIVIAIGDVTGIGPEVTLRAVAAELPRDDAHYQLLGSFALLTELNQRLGTGLDLQAKGAGARVTCADASSQAIAPATTPGGNATAARAAVEWVQAGARLCLRGDADALVTAPVNKEAIIKAGVPFVGQTELLAELSGAQGAVMMLLGADDRGRWLRVALATTHVPIRHVADRVTRGNILLAIQRSAQACRDLGLPRARVGVCGLNPHAGEGGEMGTEEIETVGPAVEEARRTGCDAHGPFAADTLFYHAYRGEYDAVVAMYHDQGLAPLKMIGFENGINWTLGLPFIRTSPDHGTAYDIARLGVANPSSMVAAIRLAKQLALARQRMECPSNA